jgi:MFS superfamily sulfate permease-like transporter
LDVGIIVAPLIGFLESIAIAKAFARKNDYKIDPSQELIAIGKSVLFHAPQCMLFVCLYGSRVVTRKKIKEGGIRISQQ